MSSKKAAPATETADTQTPDPAKATTSRAATPLKRISIKTVFGDVKSWFKSGSPLIVRDGKPVPGKTLVEEAGNSMLLCRLYGKCTRTTTGSNNFGEFVRFNGAMFGINALTGETFSAAQMVLPKWLEQELDTRMSESATDEAVFFGWDIFIKPDESKSLGYEFAAQHLMNSNLSDIDVVTRDFAPLPAPISPLLLTHEKAA